jgi:hypothetical protein
MMTRANTNSFHAWIMAKMPVATRPGATSGSVTRSIRVSQSQIEINI